MSWLTYSLLVLAAGWGMNAASQTGEVLVEGQVVNARTGSPVSYVELSVGDAQPDRRTNATGHFRLRLSPSDVLTTRKPGYIASRRLVRQLEVRPDGSLIVRLVPEPRRTVVTMASSAPWVPIDDGPRRRLRVPESHLER
ncbi:MAG: hypothetical protein AAF170_06020 [Bacteroidota bacterium]